MSKYKIVTILVMFLVLSWQVAVISASSTTYKRAINTPTISTSSSGGGGYVFGRTEGKGYVFGIGGRSSSDTSYVKNKAAQTHNDTVRNSIIISLATITAGGIILAYKKEEKKAPENKEISYDKN